MSDIENEDYPSLRHSDFVQYFTEAIPDESQVLSFKINKPENENVLTNLEKYVKLGLNATILFSSVGLHNQGKNKVPHYHSHFIIQPIKKISNPSLHRKRFLADEKVSVDTYFGDISMKHSDLDFNKPKYLPLSYPLKEGNILNSIYYLSPSVKPRIVKTQNGKSLKVFTQGNMTMDQIEFLKTVGNNIYQSALADNQRRDLSDERKKNKLMEIYELCEKRGFANYRDMLYWLEENYISSLSITEYPDSRNYLNNCEKVAIKLGLLKFYELANKNIM